MLPDVIALFVLSDRDGFSFRESGPGGVAVVTGMIIPAACILSVVACLLSQGRVTSFNVSRKLCLRDGISLIPVWNCVSFSRQSLHGGGIVLM